MVEMAGIGGFVLLALNVWAIFSSLASSAGTAGKVLWVLLSLILPMIGFILRLIAGPRSRAARR